LRNRGAARRSADVVVSGVSAAAAALTQDGRPLASSARWPLGASEAQS
jgi:hypothetical protein